MRKSVLVVLLGISTLALLTLCIVQFRQIESLNTKLESPKPAGVPPTAVAHKNDMTDMRETPLADELLAAEETDDGDEEPRNELHPTVPMTARGADKMESAPTNESFMSGIAKMMKNPGMQDMIRAQQKGQMDLMYGSLFKYLQLSDADLESFKGVLLDKQMAMVGISMDMLNKAKTPEEREATANQIKETTAAYEAQIKAFLGDEHYAVYQSFEETQPERIQVTMFKGGLDSADPMTDDQEDKLIRAMHEERTNFQFSATGFGDKQLPDPSQFTPDRIAKLMDETAKLQDQYVTRAATILTPGQLEQFKANQKQQRAMQEMGMKMATKMFGQPSKETPADSP